MVAMTFEPSRPRRPRSLPVPASLNHIEVELAPLRCRECSLRCCSGSIRLTLVHSKYYCDCAPSTLLPLYRLPSDFFLGTDCDVFLTHDSSSVRKAHNSGRNHLTNVRDYYAGTFELSLLSRDAVDRQHRPRQRQSAEHHRWCVLQPELRRLV